VGSIASIVTGALGSGIRIRARRACHAREEHACILEVANKQRRRFKRFVRRSQWICGGSLRSGSAPCDRASTSFRQRRTEKENACCRAPELPAASRPPRRARRPAGAGSPDLDRPLSIARSDPRRSEMRRAGARDPAARPRCGPAPLHERRWQAAPRSARALPQICLRILDRVVDQSEARDRHSRAPLRRRSSSRPTPLESAPCCRRAH
jgi:hypothetical protein